MGRLVMRKPSTATASSRLLKKNTSSRMRVNRITTPVASSAGGDDLEDIATTEQNRSNQQKQEQDEKRQREEADAKLARELQDQLNGLGGDGEANGNGGAPAPAVETKPAASGFRTNGGPTKPKASSMADSMAKLSTMNDDFFSGM